ncbi:MAG TPA: serine/threonine-protein kinase [Thermoanaerobaculia bacterium]
MSDPQPSADWARVKEILEAAFALEGTAREEYIVAACVGNADLKREVESLIAADARDWSLLDATALPLFSGESERGRIGDRIGPYEILSEIGRGGMGQVFLARRADDEFQKNVAIKLVPPGPARAFALARFRSERQISATLEHPNIARLLDGGTTAGGEPYIVMEYVEGRPLVVYAEEHGLSTEQRLRLFQQVCEAVQYAHRNLVVHRDIKPSNILVTAEGVPKLLDFGIAKLLDPAEVAASGGETGTLFRILTPDYASPEQVRGERVSTSSDVYSLGVVLYELLSGRKPYRIETGDPAELVRRVCEEDPEKPSAISPKLSSDLDGIVLKAMRKEPEHRYASVDALSTDIGRYLAGRPVEARRGSAAYRFGKFVRRNRLAVAAAGVVVLALAGGVAMTLMEARRARAAEERAERRFNDVRKLANSFLFEFHDAIRDLPGSTPARALLVRRALEYLDGLTRESGNDLSLRRELAEAYQKVGDVQGNVFMANLGDLPGAIASYDKAIALLETDVGSGLGGDAEKATLASAYLIGGSIRLAAGEAMAAVAMAGKGLPLRQELAEKSPQDARRQMELAQAYQFYAFDLSAAGRKQESYEALRKQAIILRERLASEPKNAQVLRGLSQNLYLTGEALRSADIGAARDSYRESARIVEDLLRNDPSNVQLRRDLGYVYVGIGGSFLDESQFAAAEEQFRRALTLFESLASADSKSADARLAVAMTHHNLGHAAAEGGRGPEAFRDFEEARAIYEPLMAKDPTNAWAAGMLADLYLEMGVAAEKIDGGLDRACTFYKRATETYETLRASNRLQSRRAQDADRAVRLASRCGPRPS